jgi:hypothetical protein
VNASKRKVKVANLCPKRSWKKRGKKALTGKYNVQRCECQYSLGWPEPCMLTVYLLKIKNYAGSESHSPHYLKKKSHFGTEYRKAPPPLYTIHHIHMVLAKLKHGTSNDDQISDSSDTWLIRHITCTASTSWEQTATLPNLNHILPLYPTVSTFFYSDQRCSVCIAAPPSSLPTCPVTVIPDH